MRIYLIGLMTATALVTSAATAQPLSYQTAPASGSNAGGIPVLSGGVGQSDRAMIESQQANYPLKLVFSGQGGAFLSGVNVQLADKSGNTVLSTITDGPILLASPPAGTYKMTATANGISKSQNVTVGKATKTYQIAFPIQDDAELTDSDGTYLPKAASRLDQNQAAPAGYAPAPAGYAPAPAGYAPAAPYSNGE